MKRWMLVFMMGVLPVAMTGCGGAASATGGDDEQEAAASGELTVDGQAYAIEGVERILFSADRSDYKISLSPQGTYSVTVNDLPNASADVLAIDLSDFSSFENDSATTGLDGLIDVDEAAQRVTISGSVGNLVEMFGATPVEGGRSITIDFAINNFSFTDPAAETRSFLESQDRWESPGDCGDRFPAALVFNGGAHQVTYDWEVEDENFSNSQEETIDDTYYITVFDGDATFQVDNTEDRTSNGGVTLSQGFNLVRDGDGFTLETESGNSSCAYTAVSL